MTTNTKREKSYHEIEAVLNNFKNKRYTYSDAIEIVQELIDTAVREREEELVAEIKHPTRHFTLDSEDFRKGYVQASQDIINLIQSKKV